MEEEKEIIAEQEDAVVKAIREEYENQIAELKKFHEEEIKKIREEEQSKSVKQIKALMSGRTQEIKIETPQEDLSFEEQALIDTRKILGITKGEI